MMHKYIQQRTRPLLVHCRQMSILNRQHVDPCLVGRHERRVERTGGEKGTGVCADAERVCRGEDVRQVESGDVGEWGGGHLGLEWGRRRRRKGRVGAIAGKSEKLEGTALIAGRHKQRTAMDE